MKDQPAPLRPDRGITRGDLEVVIRRAAELYTREADAHDHLSEEEVLRIAGDLGLPARHVRQALYELPSGDSSEAGRLTRWYGPPHVDGTRVVTGLPNDVLDRLEDYLVTREFLQILRRQGARAAFAPADDAISSVARAVRRPQRQWQIARSRKVLVEVRPMPQQESHVRLELDLAPQRRKALTGGLVGGALVGAPLAIGAAIPTAGLVMGLGGEPAAMVAGAAAGASAMGASVAGGVAIARARFRHRVEAARHEIASLLDRLEGGRKLDPPPAPWLRSLRSRITSTLRG